jgi:GH25 family lysozyme M1 (1,4-beta-N-acetylmuramidase)/SH3-like domain-containing protein
MGVNSDQIKYREKKQSTKITASGLALLPDLLKNGISMNKIIGTDISYYQDLPETPQGVDFNKMKGAADFVIIRAGQNLWQDPDFHENWSGSKLAGIPRGTYWFYDNRVEPVKQAEMWFQTLGGDLGELPLFADIEHQVAGQYFGWRQWYAFLERLRTLVGDKEIGIYSSPNYWRENAPNSSSQASELEYFHRYPLWIAHYGVDEPRIPEPWDGDEWLFWQFTSVGDGKAFGAESKGIDLNYFNGEESLFRRRFGLPEPDPEVILPGKYLVELTVRDTANVDAPATATLKQGDQVEVVTVKDEKDWLQIRLSDGRMGWFKSKFLTNLPGPSVPPPADDPVGSWFLVVVAALNVRAGPASNYDVIGLLRQDQMVQALAASADGEWLQVRREDGLIGWSSLKYLIKLGSQIPTQPPPSTALKQNLFRGVDYARIPITSPRQMVLHMLTIDLRSKGLQFLVTPPDRSDGAPLCTRTTSKFLAEHKLQIAINADGFSYLNPATYDPINYCRNGGDPVRPNGFAASRGKDYSKGSRFQPVVYIRQNNSVTFSPGGKIYNAFSGDRWLIEKGKPAAGLTNDVPEPRTALGLTRNERTLILLVIDGRQPGYSSGATLSNLADLFLKFGAFNAVNLDGGGSSTMVMEGEGGKANLLNSPIDNNVPGRERAVANHLGIYVNK